MDISRIEAGRYELNEEPVRLVDIVDDCRRLLKLRADGKALVDAKGNPVMIDGTGMCGGCRVTVGGETKFACVDGPEFDGHLVDYAELADRLSTYREFEEMALARQRDHNCKIRP